MCKSSTIRMDDNFVLTFAYYPQMLLKMNKKCGFIKKYFRC